MLRFTIGFILAAASLSVCARAQEPQIAVDPRQGLSPTVKRAWEKAERLVRKNRENYDEANAKALAAFQKELERMNPPVKVDEVVRQFQQEAIVKLDTGAAPPPPPPPEKDVVVFNGHRYKLIKENATWDDAKKKCEDLGGHLLSIEDRNEQAFLEKVLQDLHVANGNLSEDAAVWIAIRKNDKGKWVGLSGQEQLFSAWAPTYPHDDHAIARMPLKTGKWLTGFGARSWWFICEWDK